MLTRAAIERLERFTTGGAPVLSAYLDLDPARQVRRSYRAAFEDLIKQARAPLEKPNRNDLMREAARVQEWLENLKPAGKGLALFSCTPAELWQPYFLHVGVRDHVAFDAKPDVAPLLALLDEYERYAVAVVDKQDARLFTVYMGEIEESDAFHDFVPGRTHKGGVSQGNYERHHEAHVLWHLKRVVERLADLLARRRFDRLILAGPEEATSELRHLLPHALAERLAAVIPAEVSAGEAEILEKASEVERRIEREAEERLFAQLLETANSHGLATYGMASTLDALWRGAVQRLVVADSAEGSGSECPRCRRLEPGTVGRCPACGSVMLPTHDVFHAAMQRALEQAGNVEVVHGDAAQQLMKTGDGLGAMLRFR